MKIEKLYQNIREAIDDCISQEANSVIEDLLTAVVKGIPDDTILRAIREVAETPDAEDYQLKQIILRAESLDEALMELGDKCPKCFGSGQKR